MRSIGHRVIRLTSVDSTNNYAAKFLGTPKVQHGTVILADEQTEGKGQRGNIWYSEPGKDLTLSVILEPPALDASKSAVLNKLATLAITDVCDLYGMDDVRIKWPNDVLVNGVKLAGVLIENELHGNRVGAAVMGIGLNVNSSAEGLSGEAVSLSMLLGAPLERAVVLDQLLVALQDRWQALILKDASIQLSFTKALWGRGRWVEARLQGRYTKCRPLDVDAEGRLIVELEDGGVRPFGTDQLKLLV